jgi:hypothetical protein
LSLNEDNAIAGLLHAWIRRSLAKAASDLAAEEREQRRRAQDAALRSAASRMEEVLNRHFHGEFRKSRNPQGELGTKVTGLVPNDDGNLVRPGNGFAGYDIPESQPQQAEPTPTTATDPVPSVEKPTIPTEPTTEPVPLPRQRDPFGEGRGEPLGQKEEPKRRRRSGGFKIDFEHNGEGAPRSRYLESELLILVNLDHPELAAAHRDGDTPLFRMLAFEVAAHEYCIATAYVRMEDDPSIDAADIVEYTRITMESLTRDVADVVGDLATIPLVLAMVPVAATA